MSDKSAATRRDVVTGCTRRPATAEPDAGPPPPYYALVLLVDGQVDRVITLFLSAALADGYAQSRAIDEYVVAPCEFGS